MGQSHIFADIFNYFIYSGEQVIDPDSLEELDTREVEVPYGGKDGAGQPVQRTRILSVNRGSFKMRNNEKTNVMRVLDRKKISYISHAYKPDATMSGEEIAALLGEDADQVFKTLVTQGKSGRYYVFVVPVKEELDLKKAAQAVGEKAVGMIKQKELLPLTGYVHGGCSPIGMKKQFPTYIHETAKQYEKMFVSAGKVGFQIELSPDDLAGAAGGRFVDIV